MPKLKSNTNYNNNIIKKVLLESCIQIFCFSSIKKNMGFLLHNPKIDYLFSQQFLQVYSISVRLLIQNMIPLLAQEAALGIHDKVANIKDELESIQSFLKDADGRAERVDMSNVAKIWVKHVRKKAYCIDDVIDEYILHLAKHPQERRRQFHVLLKVFHFIIKLKPRHAIASKIQDINNDLKWLVEGPSNRMVISVVGIGGLGKTTLVKIGYDNEIVVAHFDCRAWITVSQSYKMEELLRETIK